MSNLGSLGSLFVTLGVDAAKFESDLGRAGRSAKKEAEKLKQEAIEIGKAAGVMVAAQGIAFAALVRNSINSADQMGKVSQAVGISTEALSQLNYAAEMNGVQNLDQNLSKLSKTAASAAKGVGEPADAFKALGVSVKNADGSLKSSDRLLTDVADSFSKHADGAEKSAIAQAIFGESGAKMIPFLNQGRDGIAALREEADRFGLTITGDTAAAADQFNSNIDRIGAATRGAANQVAKGLLPVLTDLSDQFVEFATDQDTARAASTAIDVTLRGLLVTGIALKTMFEGVGKALGAAMATTDVLVDGPADLLPPKMIYNIATRTDQIKAIWSGAITDIQGDITDGIEAAVNAWEAGQMDIGKAAAAAAQEAKGATTASLPALRLVGGTDVDTKAAEAQRKRMKEQADALARSLRAPEEVLRDQIALYDTYYNEQLWTAEQRTRAMAAANEDYYKSFEGIDDAAESTFGAMALYADQASRNMQDSMADFFRSNMRDIDNLMNRFLQMLQDIAAQAAASRLLSALGTAAAGSDSNFIQQAGAFLFGGGKAGGGPVSAGTSYMVGDRGEPELFTPGVSGQITPMSALGGNVTVNVMNNSSEQASVNRRQGADGQQIIDVVIGKVARNIAEGGSVGQAITQSFGVPRRAIAR